MLHNNVALCPTLAAAESGSMRELNPLGSGLIGDCDEQHYPLNTTPDPVLLHAFLGQVRANARAPAGDEDGRVFQVGKTGVGHV